MIDTLPLHLELEAKSLTDEGRFSGLASVTHVLDEGNDIVAAGAFKSTLADHERRGTKVAMFRDHDPTKPIGVWERIAETAKGLEVSGRLTKGVQVAEETFRLLKDGALSGLSIGYRTREAGRDAKTGARLLQRLDLFEISLVSLPMNLAARVTGVKAADRLANEREYEAWLREAGGFSRSRAKTLAAAFKGVAAVQDNTQFADLAAEIRARAAAHTNGK